MLASTRRAQILEYSILSGVTPEGPAIGNLGDCQISEFVRDEFGRVYSYSGVASRLSNGELDAEALRPGEFIVMPGLVYTYRGKRRPRAT